jgi:hypothetical protein
MQRRLFTVCEHMRSLGQSQIPVEWGIIKSAIAFPVLRLMKQR